MRCVDWNEELMKKNFTELSEECQYAVDGACGGTFAMAETIAGQYKMPGVQYW